MTAGNRQGYFGGLNRGLNSARTVEQKRFAERLAAIEDRVEDVQCATDRMFDITVAMPLRWDDHMELEAAIRHIRAALRSVRYELSRKDIA